MGFLEHLFYLEEQALHLYSPQPKATYLKIAEGYRKVNWIREKNLQQQHKIHQKYFFASTEVSILQISCELK